MAHCIPANRLPSRHFKVAIFKHDRLGDLILASGAIRTIVAAHGAKDCVLIVSPIAMELARQCFPEITIIALPGMRRLWRLHGSFFYVFLWWILRGRFGLQNITCDTLISLRHHADAFYDLIYSRLLATRSFGVRRETRPFAPNGVGSVNFDFTQTVDYPNLEDVMPFELEAHRRVLCMALGRFVSTDEVLPRIERSAQTKDFLLLSPYGSAEIRSYPRYSLIEALQSVRKESSVPFVVCVAPGDRLEGEELTEEMRRAGLSDVTLTTPSTMRQFVDLLDSARCVFSVETATAHLAVALDQATVTVIGGGHYGQFGPWRRSGRQVWLTNHLPCFYCDWKCIYAEARCITEVSPQAVANALLDRLIPNRAITT